MPPEPARARPGRVPLKLTNNEATGKAGGAGDEDHQSIQFEIDLGHGEMRLDAQNGGAVPLVQFIMRKIILSATACTSHTRR